MGGKTNAILSEAVVLFVLRSTQGIQEGTLAVGPVEFGDIVLRCLWKRCAGYVPALRINEVGFELVSLRVAPVVSYHHYLHIFRLVLVNDALGRG